jgi:hypothetical protein
VEHNAKIGTEDHHAIIEPFVPDPSTEGAICQYTDPGDTPARHNAELLVWDLSGTTGQRLCKDHAAIVLAMHPERLARAVVDLVVP